MCCQKAPKMWRRNDLHVPQHFYNAITFINNIIINIYFNNMQMIINGRKRKDEIVAFKSKRTKRKHSN